MTIKSQCNEYGSSTEQVIGITISIGFIFIGGLTLYFSFTSDRSYEDVTLGHIQDKIVAGFFVIIGFLILIFIRLGEIQKN